MSRILFKAGARFIYLFSSELGKFFLGFLSGKPLEFFVINLVVFVLYNMVSIEQRIPRLRKSIRILRRSSVLGRVSYRNRFL